MAKYYKVESTPKVASTPLILLIPLTVFSHDHAGARARHPPTFDFSEARAYLKLVSYL